MLFGSLFSGYVMLRTGSDAWPGPIGGFPWLETLLLVGASAAFGSKRSHLIVSNTLSLTFVAHELLIFGGWRARGIDRADRAADSVGVLNILMLPVNRTAVIQLTNRAVIHSSSLNGMRVERRHDLAGLVHADRDKGPGVACSQSCCLGHCQVRSEYYVVGSDHLGGLASS